MNEKDTFIIPPISAEMRRRLEEAVGRVANPGSDEPRLGGNTATCTRPTYFVWMLRADR